MGIAYKIFAEFLSSSPAAVSLYGDLFSCVGDAKCKKTSRVTNQTTSLVIRGQSIDALQRTGESEICLC